MSVIARNRRSAALRPRTLRRSGVRGLLVAFIALATVFVAPMGSASAQDAPPANDSIRSATVIDALPFTASQDTLTATSNTDGVPDPAPICSSGTGFTVWYRFATAASAVTISANADSPDGFPPLIDIYRRDSTGGLTPVGCATNGAVHLRAHGTYFVMLDSFTPRPTFTLTVLTQ